MSLTHWSDELINLLPIDEKSLPKMFCLVTFPVNLSLSNSSDYPSTFLGISLKNSFPSGKLFSVSMMPS